MLAPATPKASTYHAPRTLSQREKEKIVQLFDIELESRLNDLKAHLDAKLSNLVMYANNQITRLPPSVRTVTLGEFGEKYNGEISALVRGMASLNVLKNNPIPPSVGKRKRMEGADEKEDDGDSRRSKTARQASASPQKLPARTAQGTPGPRTRTSAIPSSSSRQFASRPPQIAGPSTQSFKDLKQPTSALPSHSRNASNSQSQSHPFPHSSSTFDPQTKQQLPAYPRPMRPDEVILSENGSPVANPFNRSASGGSSMFSFSSAPSKEMHEIEREISISRIVVARDSSSTTGTRSSQATAVEREGSMGGMGVTGKTFGSGLMLQVKTASGNMVAFDPLQTLPEDLEAREDLPKEDKKAIANAMLQFASNMESWGNLASS